MNWITLGGMAGLLAATGAAAQVVEVRAGDVHVERWPGGRGVASPGGTIYGEMDDEGGVKAYYQAGEFLCDDITTSLERPGLLALVEFTWVVGPGHAGDSNCEVRFAADKDGTPDMEPWLGGFDIRDLALDEGTWIVTVDLVGVEDLWLPPGRVWFGVRYTDDADAALLGQLVGGRPGIGSSDDLLFQPTKGLFDLAERRSPMWRSESPRRMFVTPSATAMPGLTCSTFCVSRTALVSRIRTPSATAMGFSTSSTSCAFRTRSLRDVEPGSPRVSGRGREGLAGLVAPAETAFWGWEGLKIPNRIII